MIPCITSIVSYFLVILSRLQGELLQSIHCKNLVCMTHKFRCARANSIPTPIQCDLHTNFQGVLHTLFNTNMLFTPKVVEQVLLFIECMAHTYRCAQHLYTSFSELNVHNQFGMLCASTLQQVFNQHHASIAQQAYNFQAPLHKYAVHTMQAPLSMCVIILCKHPSIVCNSHNASTPW